MDDGDDVTVAVDGSTALVTLHGEIDATLSDRLESVTRDGALAGLSVTVDLAPVTFMDSTGIGFLLDLRSVAGGRVRLLDPSAFSLQLLQLTAVDGLFDVVHVRAADG